MALYAGQTWPVVGLVDCVTTVDEKRSHEAGKKRVGKAIHSPFPSRKECVYYFIDRSFNY